jgi:hypothetical protein
MTDPNPQDPAPPEDDAATDVEGGAFAAYDTTLQRFVGPVHRGKSAKANAGKSPQAKAAKDAGHGLEVRGV